MKIAVIGATGFVGAAVVNELAGRGHEVTAISRNPATAADVAGVRPVKADVADPAGLREALQGHDAVISTFNAGWSNPNLYEDFLQGSRSIQAAVREAGVKRLLVVGGAGSLYIAEGLQLVDTPEFPAEWKPGALAARDYHDILRAEDALDWTFLSPAIEMHQGTSGERKGHYRTGTEAPVFDANGRSVISVEDMAMAIADEIEQGRHIRSRFTVAY